MLPAPGKNIFARWRSRRRFSKKMQAELSSMRNHMREVLQAEMQEQRSFQQQIMREGQGSGQVKFKSGAGDLEDDDDEILSTTDIIRSRDALKKEIEAQKQAVQKMRADRDRALEAFRNRVIASRRLRAKTRLFARWRGSHQGQGLPNRKSKSLKK